MGLTGGPGGILMEQLLAENQHLTGMSFREGTDWREGIGGLEQPVMEGLCRGLRNSIVLQTLTVDHSSMSLSVLRMLLRAVTNHVSIKELIFQLNFYSASFNYAF